MKVYNANADLRFAQNPYYEEYERLLIDLSQAMSEGDEDKADRIRDEMDRVARWLNTAEIMRLNGLSADLYMLTNEETYEQNSYSQDELSHFLMDAWQRQDAQKTLELLRKGPQFLTSDRVAYIRAMAYDQLGHAVPSLLFMMYASFLRPKNSEYKFLVLALLIHFGRIQQAVEEARRYIQQEDSPAELLIQSCSVLVVATKGMNEAIARPLLEEASQVLKRVLETDISKLESGIVVQGFISLGSAYELLGRSNEAVEAYNSALAIDPNIDAALIMRGQLLENTDPAASTRDFERAVELRTKILLALQ